MFTQHAVGERIYLFKEQGANNTSVIISSHGAKFLVPIGNAFQVPVGQTVYFYVHHGKDLLEGFHIVDEDNDQYIGASVDNIMIGNARVVEQKNAGDDCPDYNLSKIQKSNHGGLLGSVTNLVLDRNPESYAAFRNCPQRGADVVTIRHRMLKPFSVTLSGVIADLSANGHNYTNIHCAFCRSYPLNLLSGKEEVALINP